MRRMALRGWIAAIFLAAAGPAVGWAQAVATPSAAAAGQTAPAQSIAPATAVQTAPAQPIAPAADSAQLASLLAPIALYPDALLASILTASTYPLEVVEAARFVAEPGNAGLGGDQLLAALQTKDWDPSVKSLVAFPQVLKLMNDQLDWTQRLGNAFLAQQSQVMGTVQLLRQQAQAAVGLTSTPQQTVTNDAGAIAIEPADPDQVAVPSYDPNVVYGQWPYPEAPPMAMTAYDGPGDSDAPYVDGWYFSPPIVLESRIWFWGRCDWQHHRIAIDRERFAAFDPFRVTRMSETWQHDPAHRRGVAYRDAAVQQRFQPAGAVPRPLPRIFTGIPVEPAQRAAPQQRPVLLPHQEVIPSNAEPRLAPEPARPAAATNRPPANQPAASAHPVQGVPVRPPQSAPVRPAVPMMRPGVPSVYHAPMRIGRPVIATRYSPAPPRPMVTARAGGR